MLLFGWLMFRDKVIRYFWIPFVLFFAFWALKVWFFSLETGYGTRYVERIVYGVLLAMAASYRFLLDFSEKRNYGFHVFLNKWSPYFSSFFFSSAFCFIVVFVVMEQELY